nr:hypothetical protein [Bibersteinia trehalosi]
MKKYPLLFSLFSPFLWAETVIEHNTDPVSFERHSKRSNLSKILRKSRKKRPLTSLRIHLIRMLNGKLTKPSSAKIGQRLNRF